MQLELSVRKVTPIMIVIIYYDRESEFKCNNIPGIRIKTEPNRGAEHELPNDAE